VLLNITSTNEELEILHTGRSRFSYQSFDAHHQRKLILTVSKHIRRRWPRHFVVPALSYLGAAYGVAGKRDDADKILDQLFALKQNQYVSPFSIARVYCGLNETDKAFDWFERAFEERSGEMVALKSEALANLNGQHYYTDTGGQSRLKTPFRLIRNLASVQPIISPQTCLQTSGEIRCRFSNEANRMKLTRDIQSLSTFKRDTAKLVRQLKKTGGAGCLDGKRQGR
jgi:tetratricopeptide (TPR) repeat protein